MPSTTPPSSLSCRATMGRLGKGSCVITRLARLSNPFCERSMSSALKVRCTWAGSYLAACTDIEVLHQASPRHALYGACHLCIIRRIRPNDGCVIFLFCEQDCQIASSSSTQNNFDVCISQRLYTTFKPAQCVKNMYNVEHIDVLSQYLTTKPKPAPDDEITMKGSTKDATKVCTPSARVDCEDGQCKAATCCTAPVMSVLKQKGHSMYASHQSSVSVYALCAVACTALLIPILARKHVACTTVWTSVFALCRSFLYFKLNAKLIRGCLNCSPQFEFPTYKYAKTFWKQHAAFDILPLAAVELVQLVVTAQCQQTR